MSLAEMKTEAAKLSADELEELGAYIIMLSHGNDAEWRQDMARRADAMQAGEFATKEEMLAIHERLTAEGR